MSNETYTPAYTSGSSSNNPLSVADGGTGVSLASPLIVNNNKISIRNSRFPFIARNGVRQVMASPPTVSWSTTSPNGTITSATIATNVLTVVTPGIFIIPGMTIAGTGVTANTVIQSQLTGTTGGAGTYQLNFTSTVASPISMTGTLRTVNTCDNYANNAGTTGRPIAGIFSYSRARSFAVKGAAGVQRSFIVGTNVSFTTGRACDTLAASFTHTGYGFVVLMGEYGNDVLLKVDDQYVTLTPQTFSNSNIEAYGVVMFATSAKRRIDVLTSSGAFGGIMCGANDPVCPSEIRGPTIITVGDSYIGGAASFASTQSWFQISADLMGWDDAISSGIGGSGFISVGSGSPYFNRLATDVFPYNPDMVIFQPSVNDASYTPAVVAAAAAQCFAACQTNIPNALIVCTSPMINVGNDYVGVTGDYLLAQTAAIQAVCAQYNVIFINIQNQPFPKGYTPENSTIASNVSAGGKTLSVSLPLKAGGTYQFPDGSQVNVINTTGGSAPYSASITNCVNAQTSGSVLTEVGAPVLTGNGADPTVGGGSNTYTGIGTADVMRSSDGIHPTVAGQTVYAEAFLNGLLNVLFSN